MAKKIKIITEATGVVIAELSEKNPKTAEAIWNALPFEASANTWGDEIYFSIPVEIGEENAQETVDMGDLAYWPPGTAMCIFFGPTPVSTDQNPRAYSPVTILGRVLEDATLFRSVKDGNQVKIERLE